VNRHKTAGDVVGLGPGSDLAIELGDFGLQKSQHLDETRQAGARRIRNAGRWILDLSDEPLDVRGPLRRRPESAQT
jgi:hypothetical protein